MAFWYTYEFHAVEIDTNVCHNVSIESCAFDLLNFDPCTRVPIAKNLSRTLLLCYGMNPFSSRFLAETDKIYFFQNAFSMPNMFRRIEKYIKIEKDDEIEVGCYRSRGSYEINLSVEDCALNDIVTRFH